MSYREVTMIELKEILRLWRLGVPKKRIATLLGVDAKTVRRYTRAAKDAGLDTARTEASAPTEEEVSAVLGVLRHRPQRDRGEAWAACEGEAERLRAWLADGVRLSKVARLLRREGILVPYSTLHRYAVERLDFGRAAPTVPVVDGEPGRELQVDTGWVIRLEPDPGGRSRRLRAWIFTPAVSRYRFVWPTESETTASAIEACEAAWDFYGGVFAVLVPDNTKAIVVDPDPLGARIVSVFLEYAQARGFVVDPARAGRPRDKARVERAVRDVRDDCFGGERLRNIAQTWRRARQWCEEEYGLRRHSTTGRLPREHFESEEKPRLLPVPTARYDVPSWYEPLVGRDHFAQVARSLYSLPTRWIGRRLRARADRTTVRFYDGATLVKTHPRVGPGLRSTDVSDFPPDQARYATRDIDLLARQAAHHGKAIGAMARALLDGPLPWTRMRRVYALLGLVRRYGRERVEAACQEALGADMLDVRRLSRMLVAGGKRPVQLPLRSAEVIPLARYLRPASTYALERSPKAPSPNEEENE
jgi:transposase